MRVVVGFDSFGREIAERLSSGFVRIERRVFPDGEACPRIEGETEGKHAVFVNRISQGMNVNTYIIESVLVLRTLRESGAKSIDFVMPYMAYSRQAKAYRAGEPQSAKFVLDVFRDAGASRIFTVSSHYERDKEVIPSSVPVRNINGFRAVAEYAKSIEAKNPVVAGPDLGVSSEAKRVAELCGYECLIMEKERRAEGVEVKGSPDVEGKDVILVDDIISTGSTMMKAAGLCRKNGARSVHAAAVHGVFASRSLERMRSVFDSIAVSDSIETPVSLIRVSGLIAEGIGD